jgi:hypothetical protein
MIADIGRIEGRQNAEAVKSAGKYTFRLIFRWFDAIIPLTFSRKSAFKSRSERKASD